MVSRRVGLMVGTALLFGIVCWFGVNALAAQAAQSDQGAVSAPAPKEEAWQKEDPPGWDKWTDKRKEEWKNSLDHAKDTLRQVAQAREAAMLRAAEIAARKGVPVAAAEAMARMGMEAGLEPADYDVLAQSTADAVKAGTKGRELTAAMQHEVERLKGLHVKPATARAEEKPAAPKTEMKTDKPTPAAPTTAAPTAAE